MSANSFASKCCASQFVYLFIYLQFFNDVTRGPDYKTLSDISINNQN